MTTNTLLQKLKTEVEDILQSSKSFFYHLSHEELNEKLRADKWSILECIQHLNLYADFYLVELEKAIGKSGGPFIDGNVKYTWIGSYSIKAMDPANTKKQKTFRHMNPSSSHLKKEVLDNFIQHQHKLLNLLDQALLVNIEKEKVKVEFFRLLKMSIAETFQFVVIHQHRHLLQAKKLLRKHAVPEQAALVL